MPVRQPASLFYYQKKNFFCLSFFTGFLLPDEFSQVAQNRAANLIDVLMCAITLGYTCASAVASTFPPPTTDFLYDVRPPTDYVSTPPRVTFGITCAHPQPRAPFPPLPWPFFLWNVCAANDVDIFYFHHFHGILLVSMSAIVSRSS